MLSGYDARMIHHTQILRGTALCLCVAISGSIATPVVALADTASTAAAIAAIGAIVGTLIYDSNRHQYYYVDNHRNHVYVSNTTAQGWYERQDPQYYRAHENDFHHNPSQFDREYRGSHGHPPHP